MPADDVAIVTFDAPSHDHLPGRDRVEEAIRSGGIRGVIRAPSIPSPTSRTRSGQTSGG